MNMVKTETIEKLFQKRWVADQFTDGRFLVYANDGMQRHIAHTTSGFPEEDERIIANLIRAIPHMYEAVKLIDEWGRKGKLKDNPDKELVHATQVCMTALMEAQADDLGEGV